MGRLIDNENNLDFSNQSALCDMVTLMFTVMDYLTTESCYEGWNLPKSGINQ